MNKTPFSPENFLKFISDRFKKTSFKDLNRKQKREAEKNFSASVKFRTRRILAGKATKRINPFKPAKHSRYIHKGPMLFIKGKETSNV